MSQIQAENRSKVLNALVKHPALSYRPTRVTEFEWGVGQFLDEDLVGIQILRAGKKSKKRYRTPAPLVS